MEHYTVIRDIIQNKNTMQPSANTHQWLRVFQEKIFEMFNANYY
jgi:hypothetical protein